MLQKVNLAEKLSTIDEHFQPRIVGYYNDNKIQVGKIKGEFVWHSHPDTDDFFLVLNAGGSRSSSATATSSSATGDSSSSRAASSTARSPMRRRTSS